MPRPLDKIASGGELSRIALALKTCATGGAKGRTLVFDEVDAGIGGIAAESVGKKLKAISARSQVLCNAPGANRWIRGSYHAEKKETKGRTIATAEELTGDARTPRNRPHALRPAPHAGSIAARRATHSKSLS